MSTAFSAGDRVALSARFLRSNGDRTLYSASLRGTVLEDDGEWFATIRWDDCPSQPTGLSAVRNIFRGNIVHVRDLAREAVRAEDEAARRDAGAFACRTRI